MATPSLAPPSFGSAPSRSSRRKREPWRGSRRKPPQMLRPSASTATPSRTSRAAARRVWLPSASPAPRSRLRRRRLRRHLHLAGPLRRIAGLRRGRRRRRLLLARPERTGFGPQGGRVGVPRRDQRVVEGELVSGLRPLPLRRRRRGHRQSDAAVLPCRDALLDPVAGIEADAVDHRAAHHPDPDEDGALDQPQPRTRILSHLPLLTSARPLRHRTARGHRTARASRMPPARAAPGSGHHPP